MYELRAAVYGRAELHGPTKCFDVHLMRSTALRMNVALQINRANTDAQY